MPMPLQLIGVILISGYGSANALQLNCNRRLRINGDTSMN